MAKLKLLSGRIPDPYLLPTPSFGLNKSLGGGLMSGRIHVFWGPKASGKTTASLYIIAEAQRRGKRCLYVDAEKTFVASWAEKCGVDLDQLLVARGNEVEDITDTIVPMLTKNEIDLVIVDSLSSVFVESYLTSDSNAIGVGARSQNTLTAKLLNALGNEQMVILIAHSNLANAGQQMVPAAKISKSVEHWASCIIKFRQGMSKTTDRRDYDRAVRIYWEVQKSKQSVYPDDGSYWFNPDTVGFDFPTELAEVAVQKGYVEKKAAWIYIDQDTKFNGEPQFASALRDDPALFAHVAELVSA